MKPAANFAPARASSTAARPAQPICQIARHACVVMAGLVLSALGAAAQPVAPGVAERLSGWETLVMPSANMEPTLHLEEALLVDLKLLQTRPLRAGDIVAYNVPHDPKVQPNPGKPVVYIMRVVGVAGDKISVVGGTAHNHGAPLAEPYADLSGLNAVTASAKEVLVPADHVYVLGDRRGNSLDSRFTGPVALRAVRGVVRFAGRSPVSGPFRSVAPVRGD